MRSRSKSEPDKGLVIAIAALVRNAGYSIDLNLIRQGIIDVIAFSSTAEVESFLTMVNSQSDYPGCMIACFGPYTTANARKLGMNVSIVGKNYSSFEGFAEAMSTTGYAYADLFTLTSSSH